MENMEELLKRYQKMCIDSARCYPDYYRTPDLDLITYFFKDVDCKEYYFKDAEKRFYDKKRFVNLYAPVIEEDGQVALLDNTQFEIISKYKRVSLNMERNDPEKNLGPQVAIEMVQSTPDGIYYFAVKDHVGLGRNGYFCDMYFYPGQLALLNVGVNEPFFLLSDERVVVRDKALALAEEDIAKIANKIYRNGMPYLHEIFKNGGTLEMTEEDRKYYVEDKESIHTIQSMNSSESKVDVTTENVSGVYERSTNTNSEVVEKLLTLRDMGIELSPEQTAMVSLHEKLNSDKFQQYKDNSEARKERQREVRNEIALENERKENWYNSPENPSNKRIEELKHMKRQIQGLETLRDIDADLLSDEQNDLVEKGNVFFEMMEEAQSQGHDVDTGMSPEIRSWYQEHYTNEENKAKK